MNEAKAVGITNNTLMLQYAYEAAKQVTKPIEEKKKTQWTGALAVPINTRVHATAWADANLAQFKNN